ncbi:MAG: hypothetical protein M1826_000769 [Phylliscum demangeonii]|nr:MAG: hypothetical protein M1826_000769 [Phylliscum demangeonii]
MASPGTGEVRRLFSARGPAHLVRIGTFIGHKGAVWQARISSDATLAATGSADFTAKVWDTHTGENLHTFQHAHIVRAIAFPSQPRPDILATGGAEKKLRIYDLSRASTTSESSSTSANGINGAAATNGSHGDENHYEIGPGVHGGTIKSIVWGADPNLLVTAADDKKMRWWDMRSRAVVAEFELDGMVGSCEMSAASASASSGGSGSGNSGGFGPHGVLSVAAGKSVYFFDGMASHRPLKTITTRHEIASVALHTEKRQFVTGASGDTWVRVWDYDEGKELELSKGHHGPIWSVSFSPDGKLYATGSEDGTIKLWKFCATPYGLWR